MKNSIIKKTILAAFILIFNSLYAQNTEVIGTTNIPNKQPKIFWKFKVNGSIVASPIIDNRTIYFGSLDSTLYAIDKLSGKVTWKFRTGGTIRSAICIENDNLFLLSDDGVLYCLNKNSGKVVWVFRTFNGYMGDRRNDFADYYSSSPLLNDGAIYFGSGEYVYALSIIDGKVIWTYKTGDVVHSRPAISNEKLFIGSFDGNLYALNAKSGNLLWKFKTVGHRFFPKGEVMGNPVVAKDLVLFGARDYNLYAADVNGGFCHWMKQFPKGWALPITIKDSIVYLGTSDDRKLFAYDIISGKELWSLDAGFNIFGECAIGKTLGYFGTLSGKIIGFNLKTGNKGWEVTLDGYDSNHLKYLKPDDSYRDDISTIIQSNQDILKMYYNLGAVFSKPLAFDDLIVITCYDGMVYCLKQ